MKDETYLYIQDVIEKKTTARSARNRRTHNGRGGRVRLPSDNLTKKELENMNGEVKSYKLNSPMTWKEFKALPDDIKVMYVTALRKKFNCYDKHLAEMFGTSPDNVYLVFKRLGICLGRQNVHREWDSEGFYAWVHGVPKAETLTDSPVEVIASKEKLSRVVEDILTEQSASTTEENKTEEAEQKKEESIPVTETVHSELTKLRLEIDSLKETIELLAVSTEKLEAENDALRKERDIVREDLDRAKAQLEIVHLIFGGRKCG